MRNTYFVSKISWYAGLFIVIGNSFYVEIYIRNKIWHILNYNKIPWYSKDKLNNYLKIKSE